MAPPDMHSPSTGSVASFHTADETSPWKNPQGTGRAGSASPAGKTEDPPKPAGPTETTATRTNHAKNTAKTSTTSHGGYSPVRRLPYELRDHVRVFLEERMYGEAIHLLTSLLAAGGSQCSNQQHGAENSSSSSSSSLPPSSSSPVWVPPPSHLAVLATLAVHPAYTSRPKDGTDLRVAGHALQYLRHILTVAGPVQAGFSTAFAFPDALRQRRQASGTTRAAGGYSTYSHSNNASAASSRPPSRPRRLRAARTAVGGGVDSDYVDVTRVQLDDEDDYPYGGGGGGGGGGGAKKGGSMDGVSAALRAPATGGGAGHGDHTTTKKNDGGHGGHGDDDDDDYGYGHGAGAATAADTYSLYLNGEDGEDDAVGARMATRDSVWMRGHDFWRVAGWALSCSVCEPARWRYWRPWLSLVVDVLEADLAVRVESQRRRKGDDDDDDDDDNDNDDGGNHPMYSLQDALLFSYLDGHGTHTNLKRVLTAIVADGSQPTLQLREVFDKETVVAGGTASGRSPSRGGAQRAPAATLARTRVLDLDNNKFGDYSDDDESAPSSSPLRGDPGGASPLLPTGRGRLRRGGGEGDDVPAASDDAQQQQQQPSTSSTPGFVESLPLRRRLFYLIILAAHYFRDDFASPDMVYRTFAVDVLRESDISVFAALIEKPAPVSSTLTSGDRAAAPLSPPSPPPPPTADDVLVGLLRHVLFPIMPSSAPKPHNVDPSVDGHRNSGGDALGVSPLVLERCFLPFAANTVTLGANVRMALALESLFRVLWSKRGDGRGGRGGRGSDTRNVLRWTPALQEAAETGVQARMNRSKPPKRVTEVEALGRDLLRRSGQRLLTMVRLAKMDS